MRVFLKPVSRVRRIDNHKMEKVVLIAYLVLPIFHPTFEKQTNLTPILKNYFNREYALNAYFCHENDALDTLTAAKIGLQSISSKILNNLELLPSNLLRDEVQHVGLFLDLRCPEGETALVNSVSLFNASFTWMLWTDNVAWCLEMLKNSRISIDSRLALLSTDGAYSSPVLLIDTYRPHINAAFTTVDISCAVNGNVSWTPPVRNDFLRFKLKAATVLYEINVTNREVEEKLTDPYYMPHAAGARRLSYTILHILSEHFNFDFEVQFHKKWFTVLPNKTGTGLLGDVMSNAIDFGITPSYYLSERIDIISMPAVLSSLEYFFMFRQPLALGSYNALIAPMSPAAWAGVLLVCFFAAGTLWILFKEDPTSSGYPSKLSEASFSVLSMLSLKGITLIPVNASVQLALLSVLVMTFLVNNLYNSSVLNGLLVQAPPAIQNLDQLIRSDLKITCFDVNYLKVRMLQNDTYSQRLMQKMLTKSDKPYVTLQEGIQLVKTGHYALYVLDDDFYREGKQVLGLEGLCSTSRLAKERPFSWGYSAVKNSPYREHLRRWMSILRENGVIPRLLRLFRANKPECSWTQTTEAFGIKPLTLAYLVFVVGLVVSAIVFIVEMAVILRINRLNRNMYNRG